MRNVLVTGGAGFIGRHLVREIKGRYPFAEITVVDYAKDHSALPVKRVTSMLEDVQFLSAEIASKQFDAIFHLAAITDTTVSDHQANVFGFQSLLDAFRHQTIVPAVVYASSAAVYGKKEPENAFRERDPVAPWGSYAISKWTMERLAATYVKRYDWPICGLRYFNVYGPEEAQKRKSASMIYQLYDQLKNKQRPRLFQWGDQCRDFVYVDDVVRMSLLTMDALLAAQLLPPVLNCGSGDAISFKEIVQLLGKELNINPEIEFIPCPWLYFFQPYTKADMSLAASTLNFYPRVQNKFGITKYVEALECPKQEEL